MKLVIDHLTRYGYDEEVKFSAVSAPDAAQYRPADHHRLDADPAGRGGGEPLPTAGEMCCMC